VVGRDLHPLRRDAGALPTDEVRRAIEARVELVDYFRRIVAQRRQQPGSDLLTALIRAEEGGGHLTEDELYGNSVLLLIAGNETTTNLIAMACWPCCGTPTNFASVGRRRTGFRRRSRKCCATTAQCR